jgi:hypothetical protein
MGLPHTGEVSKREAVADSRLLATHHKEREHVLLVAEGHERVDMDTVEDDERTQ